VVSVDVKTVGTFKSHQSLLGLSFGGGAKFEVKECRQSLCTRAVRGDKQEIGGAKRLCLLETM